jgi:TorA maturation chaperone TorD
MLAETSFDWTSTLAGEALVCDLLGKLLYEYPEREWLQGLADEAIFDEIPFGAEQPEVEAGLQLLQQWSRQSRGGLLNGALDDLRADYTRLFLGPSKVLTPPWESVQFTEERLVFQERTLEVRRWYRRFGLEVVKLYNEPDDHLGLELAFLAHLARQGLAALAQGRQAQLAETWAAQREFLQAHPLRWVPGWCQQVVLQAHTDFYRGVALVIRGVVAELASKLETQVPAEAMA